MEAHNYLCAASISRGTDDFAGQSGEGILFGG
jgi:hypothetical protein